jgi:hypothetical protein
LLVLNEWSLPLTLQILDSWLNTTTAEGWQPPVHIIGDEARDAANQRHGVSTSQSAPPTLFLVVDRLVSRASGLQAAYQQQEQQQQRNEDNVTQAMQEIDATLSLLTRHYDTLQRAFEYLRSAHAGTAGPNTYRWHGLVDGLHDHPRGGDSEHALHLDLWAWLTYACRVMRDLHQMVRGVSGPNPWITLLDRHLDQLPLFCMDIVMFVVCILLNITYR